ncbi:MAG: hypothetical protein LBL45_07225 [Treponema sp.]|jgi:hypothetical protein|nr:hypothetical protein [Treponema sp.]
MREERELLRLKMLHPNEFAQLYEEALIKYRRVYIPETFTMQVADNGALLRLKAKYGVVK